MVDNVESILKSYRGSYMQHIITASNDFWKAFWRGGLNSFVFTPTSKSIFWLHVTELLKIVRKNMCFKDKYEATNEMRKINIAT